MTMPPSATIFKRRALRDDAGRCFRTAVLDLVRGDNEPLFVTGKSQDQRSYELAFAMWRQARLDCSVV